MHEVASSLFDVQITMEQLGSREQGNADHEVRVIEGRDQGTADHEVRENLRI